MDKINYQEKVIELTAQISKLKQRSDKGKPRAKYDSALPKHYKSYLKRANRKGIAFEIPVEVFNRLCNLQCVYCGGNATGLDRVDSSEGYIEDNIVPCCSLCNTMKLNHSTDRFLSHVEKIHKHQQGLAK